MKKLFRFKEQENTANVAYRTYVRVRCSCSDEEDRVFQRVLQLLKGGE
ncbi:hypothetical protein [Alkaliphilus hydrothermalis]|nr:hypothetical protein [Alkaliphilus hydrothermalis]